MSKPEIRFNNVVKITTEDVDFPQTDTCHAFYVKYITAIDDQGETVTFTLFSKTPVKIEETVHADNLSI